MHAVEQDVVANASRPAAAARTAGSPVIRVQFDSDWHRVAAESAVTHLAEVATVDELVAALGKRMAVR